MESIHERLIQARVNAGFETARVAAESMGVAYSTYAGHENGTTGLRAPVAERYARKFKVSLDWLLTGKGVGVTSSSADNEIKELQAIWPQLANEEKKTILMTARVFAGRARL